MDPLHHNFFDEAQENLALMEQGILGLDLHLQANSTVQLDAVFRSAHSVKGAAATFGLGEVADLMHLVESLLDRLRSRQLVPGAHLVDLILEAVDAVRELLLQHQSQTPVAAERYSGLAPRLRSAALGNPRSQGKRLLEIRIAILGKPEGADGVVKLFADIAGLGDVALLPINQQDARVFTVRTDAADEELMDLFAFHVAREQVSIQSVSAQSVVEVGTDANTRAALATAARPSALADANLADSGAMVRVAASKIDQLISVARELVGIQARLEFGSQSLDRVSHAPLLTDLGELRRGMLDFEKSVWAIRMVTASAAFSRIPRVLRDLSLKLGKKFVLETKGGAVELDQAWLASITDALIQLVRNSCDHGIESPAERRAIGKPEAGTISLSASSHEEGTVVEVRDDGRGLIREKLVSAARARGIEVPDQLCDSEVWQLVFVPGLSTMETVTVVSGRGVGMDVVQRRVAAIGGTVECASTPGVGTHVSLRLPRAVTRVS